MVVVKSFNRYRVTIQNKMLKHFNFDVDVVAESEEEAIEKVIKTHDCEHFGMIVKVEMC